MLTWLAAARRKRREINTTTNDTPAVEQGTVTVFDSDNVKLLVLLAAVQWLRTRTSIRKEVDDSSNRPAWPRALYALNFAFGDTQLVVSIALFVATFYQICNISAYHFEVACWLLTTSALVGITNTVFGMIIEKEGGGRTRSSYPYKTYLSLRFYAVLVVTLVALLVVPSLQLASQSGWPSFHQPAIGTPAMCYLERNGRMEWRNAGLSRRSLPISTGVPAVFSILVFGWLLGVGPGPRSLARVCRDAMGSWLMPISLLVFVPLLVCLGFAYNDISRLRRTAISHLSPDFNENAWTFGQVVPVVLLVLPVISFFREIVS